MYTVIMCLILSIAAEMEIPPYFALAIAVEENWTLNPLAVSPINENGTVDRGIMQLNSRYFDIDWSDPETNIRAGCRLIKYLITRPEINTYWAAAVAYNCGYAGYLRDGGPPEKSVAYGGRVMKRWLELQGLEYVNPVINKRKGIGK
jgi:soluble lytic murein transglycosylase-like protein